MKAVHSKIPAWSLASFQALWAVTDWDQTSENREGDPIVLNNKSFVWMWGPTSGGGDKLDSPVSPFRLCFPRVGTQKQVSAMSTSSLMIASPSLNSFKQLFTSENRKTLTYYIPTSPFLPQIFSL